RHVLKTVRPLSSRTILQEGQPCFRMWNPDSGRLSSSLFRSVLRPPLLAVVDSARIQRATNNVIPHTRKVLDLATADEHNRVFLQVVALARNIGGNFHIIRQPNSGDLTKRGVGLLRGHGANLGADAALLRCAFTSSQPPRIA